MKKFLTVFLALMAMLTVFAVAVSADEAALTDYTVFLDGKTNTTLYTSAEADGVITYTSAGANLKTAITGAVTFQSLDTKTATVDENGKVTPVKTGAVLIRVWDADGEKLGDYKVYVVNRTVTGITIVAPTKTYYVGDKIPLTDVQVKFSYNNGDSDSSKVATTEYTLTYDDGVVDTNGRLLLPGDHIKVYVTSTNNSAVSTYFEVKVITNVVKSLTLSIAGGGSHFSEGSVLPGLNVIAKSTNGSESTVTASQYTIYISSDNKNWEAVTGSRLLKTTDKYIKVHYNGVDSNVLTISVTATSSGGDDDSGSGDGTDTSDFIGTVSGLKTTSYKVGDKIDWTGVTITLKNGDTTVTTLSSDFLVAYSALSSSPFARTFTKDDVKGTGKTNIVIEYEYDGDEYLIPVAGLTVTESLGELSVYSVDAVVFENKTYATGHEFTLDDISYVVYGPTASTSKVLSGDDLESYSNISVQVLTSTGALKSTKKTTIEASNVVTKDGKDYVNVRFYIGTKYINTTVPVSDPDISVYYNGTLLDSYTTIDEAIAAVAALSTTEYPPIAYKTTTIMLGDDAVISDNTTIDVTRIIEINLNGNKLTLDSDTIDPDMGMYYLTITNTSTDAGTFTYDDKDIDVVLAKGDKIRFADDYDEEDQLPGVYTLTLDIGDDGEVESDPKADKNDEIAIGHGSTLTLAIAPDDGYAVEEIAIGKTKIDEEDDGYSVKDGVVTLKITVDEDMDGDTIKITFAEADPNATWENPFSDVSKSATYYTSVAFVNRHGLFNGTSDTKFSPSSTMTRAMFVTVLGRLAGLDADTAEEVYGTTTKYTDVRKGDSRYAYYSYAVPYIVWATENGIIEGHGGNEKGTFGPEDPITHQQMYVIMKRYATYIENLSTNATGVIISYTDKADIADWALDAVKYAKKMDFIVTTSTNKISPTTNAKRSELAMLIEKFCLNVLEWED